MQTIYTTSNRLGVRDNVIDLNAYRRRMEQETRQAPALEVDPLLWAREERPARKARRADRAAHFSAWLLDICASAGVLAMTAAFTVQIL
jgi:hypothetical protein